MKTIKNENTAAYYFHQGTSDAAYLYLGCHMEEGEEGFLYTFRTWAPNARAVSLVSDKTGWEEGLPFSRITERGIWECCLSSKDSLEGMPYKFRILSPTGVSMKGDPYAFYSKGGSDGASIVVHNSRFVWEDEAFLSERKKRAADKGGLFASSPLHIYELHLGSFMRKENGEYLSYRELADALASYVGYMGYTHVELLPVAEHPFDGSWGYQVCAFYAPTSRFGTPDDFRYFVNTLHKAGIGVIIDWVPAHFPKDAWGLYEFDGQPLYEYQGKDRMESRSWGTRFFDLGREEVQSFLVSNALYFMREFHIDGLRVDAVASMLYLDYDRLPGEWIPNVYGDHRNLEAIAFLQKLNERIDAAFPDVLMIAEESTAWGGVTHSVKDGGLGFDMKWNMGFANDFYRYLSTDPLFRRYHHTALNFPLMYAYAEHYILPISHDEVVHGKKSLLNKCFGNYEDKFATFRAAMMLQMSYPGKKMIFMGTEYGSFKEWDYQTGLEWFMLDFPMHRGLRDFVRALNELYLKTPALFELDFEQKGFSWVLADEGEKNAVVYRRFDKRGRELLAVISFSGAPQTLSFTLPNDKYAVVFDAHGARTAQEYKAENGVFTIHLSAYDAIFLVPKEENASVTL
ncbi:MAG: 1,4-alpha-glucan branching protein GlgB [Clostridia bacterium]|nr:1,4-alpha-glucan branching protein GlgB [Clostridia bacterium]